MTPDDKALGQTGAKGIMSQITKQKVKAPINRNFTTNIS